MESQSPQKLFSGTLLVVAPHMDDEILGCGGIGAQWHDLARVHILFAGDGLGSFPKEVRSGADRMALMERRKEEARAAARTLGYTSANLSFLDLPEWHFRRHKEALRRGIIKAIEKVNPAWLFFPFRYDRHSDHVATHHAVATVLRQWPGVTGAEYFVYHRWKLLQGGDIRAMIRPEYMVKVDIGPVGEKKRKALQCYGTQVTAEPGLRTVPVLSADLIAEESRGSEWLLKADTAMSDRTLFLCSPVMIRLIHGLEPPLKRIKDALLH